MAESLNLPEQFPTLPKMIVNSSGQEQSWALHNWRSFARREALEAIKRDEMYDLESLWNMFTQGGYLDLSDPEVLTCKPPPVDPPAMLPAPARPLRLDPLLYSQWAQSKRPFSSLSKNGQKYAKKRIRRRRDRRTSRFRDAYEMAFPIVSLHLTEEDCFIPSTWWVQAKIIRDSLMQQR